MGPGRPELRSSCSTKALRPTRTSGSTSTTRRSSIPGRCTIRRRRRTGSARRRRFPGRRNGCREWRHSCSSRAAIAAAARLLWQQIHDSAEHEYVRDNAAFHLEQLDAVDAAEQLTAIVRRYDAETGSRLTSFDPLVRARDPAGRADRRGRRAVRHRSGDRPRRSRHAIALLPASAISRRVAERSAAALSDPAFVAVVGGLGLLVGSFLNVCIHRLPLQESILWGRSHCPACTRQIRAWENVPVLSWMMLRGRCAGAELRSQSSIRSSKSPRRSSFAVSAWLFGPSPLLVIRLIFSAAMIVLVHDRSRAPAFFPT